jgi:heme-degrading monooxygenase HmoA
MIGRVWKARATPANAEKYRRHFEQRVLPALRGMEGYAGGTLLLRVAGEDAEITVVTRWRSLEAIRAFAGDDCERAVVADEALPLLREWDQRVGHHEIVLHDEVEPRP